MKNYNTMPQKAGTAVFRTPDYGGHMHRGPVRTFFRNEVRVTGTGYRVVEVMFRGQPGDEKILCEYADTVEYLNLNQAIRVAIWNRQLFLDTAAEENACIAAAIAASDRLYLLGAEPSAATKILGDV